MPFYPGLIGYEKASFPAESESASTKICSHQTLHLGHDGRPLWFKSGLITEPAQSPKRMLTRDLKTDVEDFYQGTISQFTEFTHWFRRAGTKLADQPSWSIEEGDIMCIEKDERVEELPRVTRGSLHAIITMAKQSDEKTSALLKKRWMI